MGAQHYIHASAGSAYFHVYVEAEKAEDDIEQGLIMPLIVRVVALRNASAQTHLFVGDVERVQVQTGVIVLDCDISVLVE